MQRAAGLVYVDYIPVARIVIKNEHEFIFDWNTAHPIKNLPKAAIEEELRAAPEAGAKIYWG